MTQDRESVLYFDGSGDYITVADSEALRVTNYTVEAWIKTDGVPTGWQGIVGKPGRNYCVWLNSPGYLHHCFHTTDTNRSCFDTDNILEWNKWQHIAITNDGTTAKTYLNGELKKESPTEKPLVVDKTPLRMGVNLEGSAKEYFKGQMTEVRLWNKVRSEADIKNTMFARLKGDEDGLAGYWPLNNIANNTASDETDNENHGKIYGAVVDEQLPLLGKQGSGHDARQYVLKFDGNGDYVKIDNPPNPTDAITVSCWAKSKTVKWNTSSMLICKRNSYILHPDANSKRIVFYLYSGGWRYTYFDLEIDITQWHHYTGTFDGKIIRLYVDGVEVNNTVYSGKINNDTNPMFIGSNNASSNFFNGKITEAQVWKKALSADQIKANMDQRLTGDEDGLVGYWPLDKGHGDVASDESPKNRHGVIVNAVWDEQFPIGVVPTVTPFTKVEISDLFYEAKDSQKADQYVEITNSGTIAADISSWKIKSSAKNRTYFFPVGTTLEAGQSIKLYNDEHHAESGGFSFYSEWGVWKNKGDTATLVDAEGNEVSTFNIP
ncbi:MAG: lamin tail domain-containing protein [Crocosphaera sp.]|nr:lamin tail domain-containing protein [Crocosphaera sp.]